MSLRRERELVSSINSLESEVSKLRQQVLTYEERLSHLQAENRDCELKLGSTKAMEASLRAEAARNVENAGMLQGKLQAYEGKVISRSTSKTQ